METRQMTSFFSSNISDLTVYNVHIVIFITILKIHLHMVLSLVPSFILVWKIPQFLPKSYRFRQLITLFQKADTLRLLKIYIMFCQPAGAKYSVLRLPLMGQQLFYITELNTSTKICFISGNDTMLVQIFVTILNKRSFLRK